jgi:hypothetical protein
MMLLPYIFVYAIAIIILITAKTVAYYDDANTATRCSENTSCDDNVSISGPTPTGTSVNTSTIISPSNDDITFFYAIGDDYHASYPVVEYYEDSTTTTTEPSTIQLPSFLQHQEIDSTTTRHYIMVEYYKPYCEACTYIKDTFIKAASYMSLMLTDNNYVFQAYAINCQAYSHLCTSIHMYPTIRVYDMNNGNTIDLDYRRLHPYSIMERLGFDDTMIHTNIHKLAKQLTISVNDDVERKFSFDDLDDDDEMKQFALELDYTYNHMKQTDLEQDLHITVDTMLRQYTYVPNNLNMTTKRSLRDPPLKLESAQILRVFLELLLRIISPIKNTHLQRFHSMIKELSSSFIYISNHAGYLPVILDEFRYQPISITKSNRKGRSPYSNDCAPRPQNIILTPNDDDSHNTNNKAHDGDISDSEESIQAPYLCGLWKLLFHMIVGGGLTNYNIVATSEMDKIPDIDMVTMVRDYASQVGFGILSDYEIQILYNTSFYGNETSVQDEDMIESSEMRLALWMGTIRNEIQQYRIRREKEVLKQRIMGNDLLSVQWPSRHDCPHCYTDVPRKRRNDYNLHEYNYDRPVFWNDKIVFKYIQLEYGTPPDTIDELVQLYWDVHPEDFDDSSHELNDEL